MGPLKKELGKTAFEYPNGMWRANMLVTQSNPPASQYALVLIQAAVSHGLQKMLPGIFNTDTLNSTYGSTALVCELTRRCIAHGQTHLAFSAAQAVPGIVSEVRAVIAREQPGFFEAIAQAQAAAQATAAQPPRQLSLPLHGPHTRPTTPNGSTPVKKRTP